MKRRGFFSTLGVGVVAATGALSHTAGAAGADAAKGESRGPGPSSAAGGATHISLVAMLPVGTVIRDHTVTSVSTAQQGAQVITLAGSGGEFAIEVCLRDESSDALQGPARSTKLDLFLPNQGTGDLATHEAHGLVAMDLASYLARVEASLDTTGLTTLRARLRLHGPRVGSPRSA